MTALLAVPAATQLRRVAYHGLRHSAATLLLAQGMPQRVVMEHLGHSTLVMTQPVHPHAAIAHERRGRGGGSDARIMKTRIEPAPRKPGNLRRLEHVVEDLDKLLDGGIFPPAEFPPPIHRKAVAARRLLREAAQALGS